MAGKIKVQGDMTKMMAMQSGTPDPTAGRDRRQDQGDHRRLSPMLALSVASAGVSDLVARAPCGAPSARRGLDRTNSAHTSPSGGHRRAHQVGLAVGRHGADRRLRGRPTPSASPGCRSPRRAASSSAGRRRPPRGRARRPRWRCSRPATATSTRGRRPTGPARRRSRGRTTPGATVDRATIDATTKAAPATADVRSPTRTAT